MGLYLVLDIGGSFIKYGLLTAEEELLPLGELPTEAEQGGQRVLAKVLALVAEQQARHALSGVCIATAGMVDTATGAVIAASATMPDYAGLNLRQAIEAKFHLPCSVENDVKCAGLAESRRGAAQGATVALVLTVGTGIGGCLLLNGEVYRGAGGSACEVGYQLLDGVPWEQQASAAVLVQRVADAKQEPVSAWDGPKIFQAAADGDAVCRGELARLADLLGRGIANLCYTLNPEVVVLGGGIMAQTAFWEPHLQAALDKYLVPAVRPRLAFAKLGNRAGLWGAYDSFRAQRQAACRYAGRDLPLLYSAEVCVAGGGPAGVAAAVTAARRGARVVLLERGITLGGLQTQGNVIPCMTTWAPDSDTPFVRELKERLTAKGLAWDDGSTASEVGVWTNPETLSLVYDEMCEAAGVEVLYQTVLVDALKAKDAVRACVVQTVAGLRAVKARVFIDCTGDAVLARSAGVPSESGLPATGRNQPLSFRFEMGGVDLARVYQYVSKELGDDFCPTQPPYYEFAEARHRTRQYVLEKFMLDGVQSGELTEADAEYMQAFAIVGKPGTVSFNCPELPPQYSATDPLTYSRGVREGRKMLHRISRYFIRHMPGFEHAYLAKEASLLGARESWRIRGRYYLTEEDYHRQSRFADAVARTAWFIDAHGVKVSGRLPAGGFYEIPYRALVSAEVPNLLVAGRCISASFILQASLRIQLTCLSLGEAAGTAAAWSVQHGVPANALRWENLPPAERSYVAEG